MPDIDATPPAPPPSWVRRFAGRGWTEQSIGRSDAHVFRLDEAGRGPLFVKTERLHPLS